MAGAAVKTDGPSKSMVQRRAPKAIRQDPRQIAIDRRAAAVYRRSVNADTPHEKYRLSIQLNARIFSRMFWESGAIKVSLGK